MSHENLRIIVLRTQISLALVNVSAEAHIFTYASWTNAQPLKHTHAGMSALPSSSTALATAKKSRVAGRFTHTHTNATDDTTAHAHRHIRSIFRAHTHTHTCFHAQAEEKPRDRRAATFKPAPIVALCGSTTDSNPDRLLVALSANPSAVLRATLRWSPLLFFVGGQSVVAACEVGKGCSEV